MNTDRWWLVSAASAVASVLVVAALLWLPSPWWKLFLAIFVVVFLVVFYHNPKHRYWRMFCAVVSGWIASRVLPNLFTTAAHGDTTFTFYLDNSVGATYDFVMGFIALSLLVCEYFSSNASPVGEWMRLTLDTSRSNHHQNAGDNSPQTHVGDISGPNANVTIVQGPSDTLLKALLDKIDNSKPLATEHLASLNAEIDVARDYTLQGKPRIAIAFLDHLWRRNVDKMSPREKFRVQANLGHAYDALGERAKVAEHFFKAKGFLPDDEHAQSLEAFAYLATGDSAKASQCVARILQTFPDSELAWALRVRFADPSEELAAIEQSIPSPLRTTDEVLFNLAWAALRREESVKAEGYARSGLKQSQNKLAFKETLGAALLQRATEWLRVSRKTANHPDPNPILDEAIAAFSEAIDHYGTDISAAYAQLRFKRAVAYVLRGETAKADADFRISLEICPDEADVRHQYAVFLLQQKNANAAIEVLDPNNSVTPNHRNTVMFATLLFERDASNDRVKTISVLESIEGTIAEASEETRLNYWDTLVRALCKEGRSADALNKLQDTSRPVTCLATRTSLIAAIYRLSGEVTKGRELMKSALSTIPSTVSELSLSYTAHTLDLLSLFEEALNCWKKVVSPDWYGRETECALECARRCGDDDFILRLCSGLRTNNLWEPFCVELELITLHRYNDLDAAIALIQAYLPMADDALAKVFRVRLSRLGRQTGKHELVESDLKKLPDVDSVTVPIGCATIQILLDGSVPMEGVRYAYQLLRKNYHSADAHKALVGAVGISEPRVDGFPHHDVVQPGCAIRYVDKMTTESGWIILEDAPNAEFSRQEIDARSPLWNSLLGKRVGDEFVLREDSLQNRIGTIEIVASKFEFRCVDSYDKWEERFPNDTFVRKYQMPRTSEGEPDVSLILKSVDQRIEEAERLHSLYREHPLSMTSFAQLSHASVIESVVHLASHDDLPVRCCLGNDDDFAFVSDAFRKRSTLVLDPSALATLFLTESFRDLGPFLFKVVASHSSLSEIQDSLTGRTARTRGRTYLNKLRGKYIVSERSNYDIERQIADVTQFLDWVRNNCEIQGGSALARIESETRQQLIQMFGQATAECIAIARESGSVIWSDDYAVAELAKNDFGVKRVWTQAMAEELFQAGLLSDTSLRDLTIHLVNLGYAFTRVIPNVVIEAARRSGWDSHKPPFAAIARWFGTSGVKPVGIVGILVEILPTLWREASIAIQREDLTKALVLNVAKRPDASELIDVLKKVLPKTFGLDVVSCEHCLQAIEHAEKCRSARLILPGDADFFPPTTLRAG